MQIINKRKLPSIKTRVNNSLLNYSIDSVRGDDSLQQFYLEMKEKNEERLNK